MLDTTLTAKQLREAIENVAKLASATGLVFFERGRGGEFILLSPPPKWFQNLFSDLQSGSVVSVFEAFPAIDAFLPEAEAVWNGDAGEAVSDLWSEMQES